MQFVKAVRSSAKLRLALTGISGSGKTYSALMIAKGLGGRVAVIDSERGSASLYSDLLDFDVLNLSPPFTPESYIDAIRLAEKSGYDTIIVDSATHEWSGSGGCLEINEKLGITKYRGNSWSAWNETTPRHRAFIDALVQSKAHIIVTLRSKSDTAQEKVDGKTRVVKLGMKVEQRDGIEFEFTTVLDIAAEGNMATVSKDRTGLFVDAEVLGESTGKRLLDWLNSGAKIVEPTLPEYPESKVNEYWDLWVKSILEGKTTPQDIYEKIAKQYSVSEHIKGLIYSLQGEVTSKLNAAIAASNTDKDAKDEGGVPPEEHNA